MLVETMIITTQESQKIVFPYILSDIILFSLHYIFLTSYFIVDCNIMTNFVPTNKCLNIRCFQIYNLNI